jgi:hypothetical protein
MTQEEYDAYLARTAEKTSIVTKALREIGKGARIPRTSKYGNEPTEGADSRKEARRFADLRLMEKSGAISNLRQHVRFDMCINGVFVCWYEADAVYVKNGATVVEDTKSPITQKNPVSRLKIKLMRAVHGIDVKIV